MLKLYLEAPFAVCRTFTAGWHRPTSTFLTPSAVYGLLMNVARIETRLYEHDPDHDGSAPASLLRTDIPRLKLAIGVSATRRDGRGNPQSIPLPEALPQVQSLFQQLHNYPVGNSGMPPELSKGNKNNITPVRREFLTDVRAVIHVDADEETERRIQQGLDGELSDDRYGLPFLGDNQFLIDRLHRVSDHNASAAYWYEAQNEALSTRPYTTRFTVWIDRADMSRTKSGLFSPNETAAESPTESAWIEVGPGSS